MRERPRIALRKPTIRIGTGRVKGVKGTLNSDAYFRFPAVLLVPNPIFAPGIKWVWGVTLKIMTQPFIPLSRLLTGQISMADSYLAFGGMCPVTVGKPLRNRLTLDTIL